jgi:hypothetical protein
MKKRIKFLWLITAFFIKSHVFSQPIIIGPACVLPGVTYQYSITGAGLTSMSVCVNGGYFVDREQLRLGTCTASEIAVASILVVWNDTTTGSLTLNSSGGNTTVNISLTSALQPGMLDSLTKTQSFTDTTTVPSSIQCSASQGGSCTPVYSYQWQKSNDIIVWTDVESATGQNLSFGAPAKHTIYYRRKTVETGSGTIGYSDIATVGVALVE